MKITILVDRFYKKQLQKMARSFSVPLRAYIGAVIETFAKACMNEDLSIFENLVTKNNDLVIVGTFENMEDKKNRDTRKKKGTTQKPLGA